jgi:nucleotide-binding universal stress UspA family protein
MIPAGRSLLVASNDSLALVVGATGYGRVGAALWGSVTRHVTRHADVPVVVVREQADPDARKVVVAVDGTSISHDVIGFGLDVASYRGWDAEVLHAADAPGSWRSWTENVSGEESARQDRVERLVSELSAGWTEKYPDVDLGTSVVREGAADALVDASAGAALLVVGAHARHGLTGHLGSVSRPVVRRALCPVAVLH